MKTQVFDRARITYRSYSGSGKVETLDLNNAKVSYASSEVIVISDSLPQLSIEYAHFVSVEEL
jgi:hypothetical protein